MDDDTLAALKASIRHWQENVAAEDVYAVKLGPRYCALCTMFRLRDEFVLTCKGCPVSERTREVGCDGSPYDKAESRYSLWRGAVDTDAPSRDIACAKAAWRRAAQAELDFLIGLLPEGESPIPEGEAA